MTLKSIGPSGLELIRSCADPLHQVFLSKPTKGWPCKISGPKPFARSSSLLVDPGNICPPQAPNLWVDFEIIGPKILGPACSFWFLIRNALKMGLSSCCFWTLSNSVKTIFCYPLLSLFIGLRFILQKSVLCLGLMPWRSAFCSLGFRIHWV
jgi:hypothetical protein